MTLRTYRHFACANGHAGTEKTSENDQPYSECWEMVELTGIKEAGKDDLGHKRYVCTICGKEMKQVKKP